MNGLLFFSCRHEWFPGYAFDTFSVKIVLVLLALLVVFYSAGFISDDDRLSLQYLGVDKRNCMCCL